MISQSKKKSGIESTGSKMFQKKAFKDNIKRHLNKVGKRTIKNLSNKSLILNLHIWRMYPRLLEMQEKEKEEPMRCALSCKILLSRV